MKVYDRLAEPCLFLLNGRRYARDSVLRGAIVLQVSRAIKTPRIRLTVKGKFDIRYVIRSTRETYPDVDKMGRANRWEETISFLYTHRLESSVERHEVEIFPARDIKAGYPFIPFRIRPVEWSSRNGPQPRR